MKNILIFFAGVLIFLAAGYFAFFKQSLLLRGKTELFVVRSISCKTQFGSCDTLDEKVLENFKGVNFFSLDVGEVEMSLLSHLKNRRVLIYKVFPNSLKVFIEKRAARVALKSGSPGNSGEGYWLTDFEGRVLERNDTSGLPLMYVGSMPLDVGLNLEGSDVRAIKLLYKTYQLDEKTYQAAYGGWGVLEEGLVVYYLPEGGIVKYSLEKDVDVSVGSLQLVSSATRMDGEMPKEIDLRFKNAVLRY